MSSFNTPSHLSLAANTPWTLRFVMTLLKGHPVNMTTNPANALQPKVCQIFLCELVCRERGMRARTYWYKNTPAIRTSNGAAVVV